MSMRYNPKVSGLIQKKISSFNKKNRFDFSRIKSPQTWTRPSDWLTMPTVLSTEQKVVLLVAVYNHDSNFLAFLCSGNYTVDWGDGSIENVSSNIKAQHSYTYSTLSSTVCSEGYKMAIVTITPQAGQSLVSVDLKQLHSSISGAMSSNPISPILEFIFSCPYHGSTLPIFGNTTSFVGCHLSILRSCTILNIGSVTNFQNLFTFCSDLLNVTISANTSALTNCSYMFQNCYSLISVSLFDTSSVNTMTGMFLNAYSLISVPLFNTRLVASMPSMFQNCYSLQSVPLFNTASCLTMLSMFQSCGSLTSVPLFNTRLVTSMTSMFQGCSSLILVPLFNTESVNSMASMFNACYALQAPPLFNTASVTSMATMFQSCISLQTVPLFNTSLVNTMASMFSNCYSLQLVPLFNTSAVNTMSFMFNNCYSLQTVPLFNTSLVNTMASMFNNCYSLQTVPLFNTSLVNTMASMFSGCLSLISVPLFNTSAVTTMVSMFLSCDSLAIIPLFNASLLTITSNMFANNKSLSVGALNGTKVAISYTNCKLSKAELENIFNYLGTAPSQTLTISNNWGAVVTSATGTTTIGSTTISIANTSSIAVGMQVVGTGSPLTTAIAVTFSDTGDLVNLASHGLSDNDEVSFATIVTTTGIIINKIYYVVNASDNSFQVSETLGGSALALTTNGSGTLRYRTEVVSINPNVSVTMSRKMTFSATNTLFFRQLRTGTALLKGWLVTG